MYGMQYTDEMRNFILENYKGVSAKELADKFNARFRTDVTPGQMKSYKGNHKLDSGLKYYFPKGHVPFNKGKKMPADVYEKAKHTMFKKGNIPKNHRPVGSERITKDGYIEIKVAEPNKWRLKHNVVWEQHNGEIPRGYVVMLLDGDKTNVDISNLKLIKRSELLIMNRYDLYGADAQATDTATNLAKLIDQTNVAKKKVNKDKNKCVDKKVRGRKMKKIIEIYCCDVCGKEVDGHKELEAMILPCKETETEVDMTSTVELCAECAGKVRSLIFGSFAKIFVYKNGEVHRVQLPEAKPAETEPPKIYAKAAVPETAPKEEKKPAEPKVEADAESKAATMTNEEWADEVREMLKNGKTVHDIALHYGLNKSAAYKRMNNLGISPKQFRPR